jgi:hypothetical protein
MRVIRTYFRHHPAYPPAVEQFAKQSPADRMLVQAVGACSAVGQFVLEEKTNRPTAG